MKSRREQLIERWENCLRVLRALSPHERRKHWNMSFFGEKNECGTIACAAGHCGLDPWFRRRGFKLKFDRVKYSDGWIEWHENTDELDPVDFFDVVGAENIFYDSTSRPVGQVIKEVKNHIKWLHECPEGAWDGEKTT